MGKRGKPNVLSSAFGSCYEVVWKVLLFQQHGPAYRRTWTDAASRLLPNWQHTHSFNRSCQPSHEEARASSCSSQCWTMQRAQLGRGWPRQVLLSYWFFRILLSSPHFQSNKRGNAAPECALPHPFTYFFCQAAHSLPFVETWVVLMLVWKIMEMVFVFKSHWDQTPQHYLYMP